MTKEEAEREVEIKIKEFVIQTFCPVCDDYCQIDCVCLKKSNIQSFEGEYQVTVTECRNRMFFGDE